MLQEISLYAAELEPPEPLTRAGEILQLLRPGQYLRMLHRRVPYPLFDVCQALALEYQVNEDDKARIEIIVYFPADHPALQSEGVL